MMNLSKFDSVFSPQTHATFRAKTPDFVKPKSIKLNLNKLETGGANTLTDAFSRVVGKALKDLDSAIANKDTRTIENYQAILIPELTRSIYGMWLGGWNLGRKHGGNEIKFQQKKTTANFDEDLLDVELASIENIQAQNAIASRSKTLASDISSTQWGKIRGHILSAIQPQAETGEPINRSELLKRINSELGDRGFKSRAEKIARTELTFAYNAGRLQTYKDSGLVSHVVFLSIMDDRRCQICEDRHGMTIALDDIETISANTPPMHVQCRCVLSPRLATPNREQELKDETRASKKRSLFEAPPKWLAAGILAAILLSTNKKVKVPGSVAVPSQSDVVKRVLADTAIASQVYQIAKATGEVQALRQRRTNQTQAIPTQGVIDIQPRVTLNGIDLNSATPEQIRESLKEFLSTNQIDSLIDYLQENKILSIDDLVEVSGLSRKSKAFKLLQGLADKDKFRVELEKISTPSELWLKNWGFSKAESKAVFDELNKKPAKSWGELKQRLKKRGIPTDKLQRAIDKIKATELESQQKVVGLDDFVNLFPENVDPDLAEIRSSKLIKQREINIQRRKEALQEIKDLEIELAKIRADEKRFGIRARRMSKINPKEFISPEEIKAREVRKARVQSQIEKAQQQVVKLGTQLEKVKSSLNQLDIPNLTPEAKARTQTVETLGLEGTQLLNAKTDLGLAIVKEVDTQLSKGFIPVGKKIDNLKQATERAKAVIDPAVKIIEQTDLEDLQSRLTEIRTHYQNLLDPLYPDNYFGREVQNELTSLRAELKRVKNSIDTSVKSLQRTKQTLSNVTLQAEATKGKLGLLKTGQQLEQQAKELEDQISGWGDRVKKVQSYEQTQKPFNSEARQKPLDKMVKESENLQSQIPSFRKVLDDKFNPTILDSKATISQIDERRKQLEEIQSQIDNVLGDVVEMPITKSQIPETDIKTYNAAVELRKISREISEETKRLKALAGASRVNLDESLKTQNKLYQQYEKQRYGDETTPTWEKNLSPVVESRMGQIEGAVKNLEKIGENWNIGYLVDLAQKVDAGVDATGKSLRVRKWLDDNGLSPEDLALSPIGGKKVGLEAIRELADEVMKQYSIIKNTTATLKKDTQFKAFTDKGLVTEDNFLKWAEEQATYWQNQAKNTSSNNWQGSSYERVDKLWKSLEGKKASDLQARQSIKPDDVQGQLRKTVGKYQDWQRKYTVLKEQGEVTGNGIRTLNKAQKQLLDEQNTLLGQLDRYNLDSSNLIRENTDNTLQIWEKVKQDTTKPVFFDVKGKAIERGELMARLDAIDKQLQESLKIKEIRVEPLTYDPKKATPLIQNRSQINQELLDLEPKITELRQQIDQQVALGKGVKRLESQLSKLQLEKTNKQQQLQETIQEVRDLRLPPARYEQIQTIKQQIGATQKQFTAIQSEMAELRREITALKEQPLDGSVSGSKRQKRLDALESAITRKNNDLFKVIGVLNNQRGVLGKLRSES